MTGKTMSTTTIVAGALGLACAAAVAFLVYSGVSRTAVMVPAALGWVMALAAARPVVGRDRHAALYFAFAIFAVMMFFIHQTYGYTGKVRDFPLIVGYAGIVLSALDILSLTPTRAGTAITRVFGSQISPKATGDRQLTRELVAFAAMGGCVLGIWLFGFLVFSPIFVAAWMLAGGKTARSSLYGGIGTLAFVWLLFEIAFKYELYRGVVFIQLMDL